MLLYRMVCAFLQSGTQRIWIGSSVNLKQSITCMKTSLTRTNGKHSRKAAKPCCGRKKQSSSCSALLSGALSYPMHQTPNKSIPQKHTYLLLRLHSKHLILAVEVYLCWRLRRLLFGKFHACRTYDLGVLMFSPYCADSDVISLSHPTRFFRLGGLLRNYASCLQSLVTRTKVGSDGT